MSVEQKSALEVELGELFDIITRKARQEKVEFQEAMEAKRDIKLLTRMFSDGVKDMLVTMSNSEILEWDARLRRLVYHKGEQSQYIETANNEILIKVRPYLKEMAKKAKEYYKAKKSFF